MPLASGTRIGAYEVISAIGAGGMGEVYRARDATLHRDVALKVLPDAFANDPERLARFARESQVLASLNHQNIAHVYGFEEAGSARALVMELVEGPTLDDRIRAGQVTVEEALAIAAQIAEALEAAHDLGVVHRDLKPANIKVRDDGTTKILDFGLAKAIEPASAILSAADARAQSPTITTPAMTMQGMVLGTAAYMSPEQAKGKAVDRRADIWAFGCVLFEMLAGKRAFDGEDTADTIAAVLTKEPDWPALPPAVSPATRALLRHCLERDPRRRMSSMAIVRWELTRGSAVSAGPAAVTRSSPWLLGVAAAALVAVFAMGVWAPWRVVGPAPGFRFAMNLGMDAVLLPVTNIGGIQRGVGASAVFSPDGRHLAFAARKADGSTHLYLRALDQISAAEVAGTTGAAAPFFSPDGQWIGFFADGKLKKVALTGGVPATLCDVPAGRGGTWGPDDDIVYSPSPLPGSTLMRVAAAGGNPAPLTKLAPGEAVHRWPHHLPNGGVLFTASTSNTGPYDEAKIWVLPAGGGEPRLVLAGGSNARYVASGHLLYANNGTLFAVPFDATQLVVAGRPVPVLEGLSYARDNGAAQFSVSTTGAFAYVPGGSGVLERAIDWVGRDGATTPLRSAQADWSSLTFSPDGRRLAMIIRGDVWIYELERDVPTRLTFDGSGNLSPDWTPDGSGVTFVSNRSADRVRQLYWQRADGSGAATQLTTSPSSKGQYAWHPNGRMIAFHESGSAETNEDVTVMPIERTEGGVRAGQPVPFVKTRAFERKPRFSPDGRWLAYESDESGREEIYVRPFPGPGGKWQVSTAGGLDAEWSRSRAELVFRTGERALMVVPFSVADGAFQAGRPQPWSAKPLLITGRGYALHPDGNRIAMEAGVESNLTSIDRVTIVTNFFDELRRMAPLSQKGQ